MNIDSHIEETKLVKLEEQENTELRLISDYMKK